MTMKQLVTIMICAAGCRDSGTQIVHVEVNDVGIARVEIQHGNQGGDRLLTIRGVDDRDQEIAEATLRTGMVLYTPEPESIPAAWSAGTELTAAMGPDTFTSITPDREPHQAVLPVQPTLVTFVRLHAVAAAIESEAGISFPPPSTDEVAFTAALCSASEFPSSVGSPQQCCQDGTTTWHKIAANSPKNPNLLAWRTYSTACTTSSGGTVCGNPGSAQGPCTYGPCGGENQTISGSNTTSAAVFHPTSFPTQCGRDSNGSTSGGGIEAPEAYTGSQALYAGVTASCPYQSCCYNTATGISERQTGATCLLGDGESCTGDTTCYSGICTIVCTGPGQCNRQCSDCQPDGTCCNNVNSCGNYCKGGGCPPP